MKISCCVLATLNAERVFKVVSSFFVRVFRRWTETVHYNSLTNFHCIIFFYFFFINEHSNIDVTFYSYSWRTWVWIEINLCDIYRHVFFFAYRSKRSHSNRNLNIRPFDFSFPHQWAVFRCDRMWHSDNN